MQDTITSRGDRVTINTGAGNNSLSSTGAQVIINAGGGDDTIYNAGSDTKIYAGGGGDYVENDAPNVSISAGAGNDSITSTGDNVKIDGGADRDSIHSAGNNATLAGGDGDDTIDAQGHNNSINGGAGYDFVTSAGDNVTIENAEEVTVSGTGNLIKMKGGDIIFGFESDTGTVQADFVAATFRGQDVILTNAQGGEITIAGAKDKPVNINGVETVISAVVYNTSTGEEVGNISEALTYASAGDTLELLKDFNEDLVISKDVTFAGSGTYSGNLTLAGAGVTVGGQSLSVSSGNVYTSFDGTNFGNIVSNNGYFVNNTPNITITETRTGQFTNNGANVSIQAGQRANVTNNGANVSIQAGQSANVTNTGAAATILGEGNNIFTNSGANVSISALNGSNTVTNNTADDVTIKVADNAKATISSSDYSKTNVQATYSAATISGNNVLLNPNNNTKTVTLKNANAKVICVNGDFTMYGAAANNSTANYTWYTSPTFVTTTAANNAASVKILTATTNDSGLNKTLVSAGDNVTIAGTIRSSSILADKANNWIYGSGDNALVYLGSPASTITGGDDHVYWKGDNFSLNSVNNKDRFPMTQNVTVIGNNFNGYNLSTAVCLYLVGNNATYRNATSLRQVTIVGDSNNLQAAHYTDVSGPCVIRGNYNTLRVTSNESSCNLDDLQVTICGNNNYFTDNVTLNAYQAPGNPRFFVESGSNNTLQTAGKSASITFDSATSNNVIKVNFNQSQGSSNHTISGWKADDFFYFPPNDDIPDPTRSGNVVTINKLQFTLQNYSGSVKYLRGDNYYQI